MAKTALQLAQEKAKNLTGEQKNSILDFQAQNKQETDARVNSLKDTPTVEPELFGTTPKVESPTQEVKIDTEPKTIPKTFDSIDPVTQEKFNADGTPYQEPTIIDQGNQQIQKADELKDTALEELRVDREKAITDTKRGFALGKAKFDENKANYKNYDEINTKYNAVIDEITSNMSDTGVIDESVYQSIANKYGIPLEQVKNPNRILDGVELTEEGKENLGVKKFEQGLEDTTKNFERTKEDLSNRITQTEQAYNEQMQDANESVQDAISGMAASGAASGLFRSTAMTDSMNRTREQGAKIIGRLQSAKERTVGDIQTSLSRITEDFNQSITEAKKDFEDNYKDVNVENMVALNEAGLNFTGEKLQKALKDIEEEFGVKSQAVFQNYMNNLSAINGAVNENMDLVDRITEKEEERELKSYNEYLANDGLLLQSSTLDEIVQGVQNGTITPESAQNLRKIMQTSIQSTLGSIAPLEMSDIDNINYLLEQGYTPEQAIAMMQESFDKFTPTAEVKYREFDGNLYQETPQGLQLVQEGVKTTDKPFTVSEGSSVYDPVTGTFKTPTGTTIESGDFRNLTSELQRPAGSTNVGRDTNNPGNIMAETEKGREYAKSLGAIGYYSSPNGRTYAVFPDINTGLAATRADIKTKLSGGSSWVNENTTLGQLASGWTVGPNAPANESAISNFERISGYNRNTPISQIPEDVIIDAIFKNEGVDASSGGVDMSYLGANSERKDDLNSQVLGLTIGLGGTETERAELRKEIVDKAISDNISLAEAKKELGYKTGDDREFTKSRSADYTTFKKGISAATGNARTTLTLLDQPNTAIGDVASVVGFLKTIDPTSVARESEVEAVENARGKIDSLFNTFNKLKTGQKLTESQRADLKQAITTIVDAADNRYNDYVTDLVGEFEERGLDASVYIPKTEVDRVLKGEAAKNIKVTPKEDTGEVTETNKENVTASNGKTYTIKVK